MYKKLMIWTTAAVMLAMAPAVVAECGECDEDEHEHEEEFIEDEEVMEFLEKNLPVYARELQDLEDEDEEEYEEMIDDARGQVAEYYEMLEHNPDAAHLHLKIEALSSETGVLVDEFYEAENDSDKADVKNELEDKLNVIFDLQLKARMVEVEMLAKEISEIKSMVEKRKSNKSKIIDRHMRELLTEEQDEDEMSWW